MYPMNILLIEDDRIIAEDIRSTLTNLGHSVVLGYPEILQPGVEMRESIDRIITDSQIKLALMDIDLRTEFDGVDIAKHLYSVSDIPVIYISGQSKPETILRAKETEPYAFLLKPFNAARLRLHIEMAQRQHKSRHRKKTKPEEKKGLWQVQTGPAGIKASFAWLCDFGFEKNQVRNEEDFLRVVLPEDQAIIREAFSILKRKLLTQRAFEYRIISPAGTVHRILSKLVGSRRISSGEFIYTILSLETTDQPQRRLPRAG